jgi:urease gamma subunit
MPTPENPHINPDYEAAMNALSPEDASALQNMQLSMEQERVESFEAGETAYERAVKLEELYGLDDDTVTEYRRASTQLINAIALRKVIDPTGEQPTINPITYFKIADSLKRRATAPTDRAHQDRLVSVPDPEHVGKPIRHRQYLAELAVKYWDRGIQALLDQDPESTEVIASAVVEAARDTNNAKPYTLLLAKTDEHELAAQLEADGPEELLENIDRKDGKLEVISLASRRLEKEFAGQGSQFSLAA